MLQSRKGGLLGRGLHSLEHTRAWELKALFRDGLTLIPNLSTTCWSECCDNVAEGRCIDMNITRITKEENNTELNTNAKNDRDAESNAAS
jgi:hypothetical protein